MEAGVSPCEGNRVRDPIARAVVYNLSRKNKLRLLNDGEGGDEFIRYFLRKKWVFNLEFRKENDPCDPIADLIADCQVSLLSELKELCSTIFYYRDLFLPRGERKFETLKFMIGQRFRGHDHDRGAFLEKLVQIESVGNWRTIKETAFFLLREGFVKKNEMVEAALRSGNLKIAREWLEASNYTSLELTELYIAARKKGWLDISETIASCGLDKSFLLSVYVDRREVKEVEDLLKAGVVPEADAFRRQGVKLLVSVVWNILPSSDYTLPDKNSAKILELLWLAGAKLGPQDSFALCTNGGYFRDSEEFVRRMRRLVSKDDKSPECWKILSIISSLVEKSGGLF